MIKKTIPTLLLLLIFVFSGCISKKKYSREITQIREDYNAQILQLDKQLRHANRAIDTLTLQLAEKTGANKALLQTQDKLQDRIDALQDEIQRRDMLASDQQKSTSQLVREKEQIIAEKQKQLDAIKKLLTERETRLQNIAAELAAAVQPLDSLGKHHEIETVDGNVVLTIYESLLFYAGKTRIRSHGQTMLESVAEVLDKYPQYQFIVTGHTDNKPVKGYKDNWSFSALRAAAVVRFFTEDYGLSPAQFSAVGKGEFSPRASNEMSEGRAANRRIEITIAPRTDMLITQLKKILE
ncbi:MAG: hypothetical protein D6714_07740 [Bacteroidetes bacterium]|nr:MAG: hypothetical protein D6714_07740 [Bacteroidota bacterium]